MSSTALEAVRAAQVPFLAGVLLIAAVAKAAGHASAVRSAVVRWSRGDSSTMRHAGHWSSAGRAPSTRPGTPAVRLRVLTVAVAELLAAAGLLFTANDVVRLCVVIVFVTAAWVVEEHRRRHEGCRCFGVVSTGPVGIRALVRAVLLAAAALATLGVPHDGLAALGAAWPVIVVEVALLVAVSPETGAALRLMRRNIPSDLREIPLAETYEVLRSSEAWRAHINVLISDQPTDIWRERSDRFVVFAAEWEGRPAHVIFAVRHGPERDVRVAVLTNGHVVDSAVPERIRLSTAL